MFQVQSRFTVKRFNLPVFLQGYKDYERHKAKLDKVLVEGDKNDIAKEILEVCKGKETARILVLYLREHGFAFIPENTVVIGHQKIDGS